MVIWKKEWKGRKIKKKERIIKEKIDIKKGEIDKERKSEYKGMDNEKDSLTQN